MNPTDLPKPLLRISAALYTLGVRFRHWLFDTGIANSKEGAIKTIVLGNLTVGGTGKTPMTECIVRELESIVGPGKIGILSRGYGRKTSGFQWVHSDSEAPDVGDEPLMLKQKLDQAPVAVCENRLNGLERMKAEHPELDWVVCDDAFQHRSLKPTLSLLLIDSNQPVVKDQMIPMGRLRDLPSRMHHADAIIITRVAPGTNNLREQFAPTFSEERPVFGSQMDLLPLRTWPDRSACSNGDANVSPDQRERILAVAGIAQPDRFMDGLAERFQVVRREAFPDHHTFGPDDFDRWKRISGLDRLHALVTTEKDVMRFPKDGIAGVEVRYESIQANWTNYAKFRGWLAQVIDEHSN
ncbi:MAG: tetraacyldisaccharide 4'-kinase [Bacteroidetes bacterium]|nr:tetraacyldisaccharide 4'-kinase [Bacteroidota bacterium]